MKATWGLSRYQRREAERAMADLAKHYCVTLSLAQVHDAGKRGGRKGPKLYLFAVNDTPIVLFHPSGTGIDDPRTVKCLMHNRFLTPTPSVPKELTGSEVPKEFVRLQGMFPHAVHSLDELKRLGPMGCSHMKDLAASL